MLILTDHADSAIKDITLLAGSLEEWHNEGLLYFELSLISIFNYISPIPEIVSSPNQSIRLFCPQGICSWSKSIIRDQVTLDSPETTSLCFQLMQLLSPSHQLNCLPIQHRALNFAQDTAFHSKTPEHYISNVFHPDHIEIPSLFITPPHLCCFFEAQPST